MDGMVPALGCEALSREVAVEIYFRQKESPDFLGSSASPGQDWMVRVCIKISTYSLSSEGPWSQATQHLAMGPRTWDQVQIHRSWEELRGGSIGNTCCGAGAQQACISAVSFQMRTVRARATLTTGSKVRCGSPRAWKPFPAPALGNKPSLPPRV